MVRELGHIKCVWGIHYNAMHECWANNPICFHYRETEEFGNGSKC